MLAMRRCLLLLALVACHKDTTSGFGPANPEGQGPVPAQSPAQPEPSPAAVAPRGGGDSLSGKVVETMSSGGYTYARLDRGGSQVWIAGPQTPLAVGATVGDVTGMMMSNFHSDTLNRTFDQIYFVNAIPVGGGQAGVAPPAAAPSGADPLAGGTVVETMNAGGYTYARIERAGAQVWVAGPEISLALGATVGQMSGSPMPGFHSDTLKRTFDEIYFVSQIPVSTGAAAPGPGHGIGRDRDGGR